MASEIDMPKPPSAIDFSISATLLYIGTLVCASSMLQPSRSVVGLDDTVGGASSYFTSILPASGVIAKHPEAVWVTRAEYLPSTVAIYTLYVSPGISNPSLYHW